MPKLIIQLQGQEWTAELNEGSNTIGRQSSCSLPIKDTTLSRLHCEIVVSHGMSTVHDKGSMNGTVHNGKKISVQPLQPGDKIVIGATTLWYERKNVGSERREGTGNVRAAAAAGDPAPSSSSTRRALSVSSATTTAMAAAQLSSGGGAEAMALAATLLKDYSYHSKPGGAAGKIVAVVAVVAAVGVAAYLARGLFTGPSAPPEDRSNLVSKNASFDVAPGGKPDFWGLRTSFSGEKPPCALSVDPGRGRNGGPGLLMEKAGGAAELLAECAFQDEFPLGRNSLVEASAWTQFENFGGTAAIKIDWLRAVRGPVVAEEFSEPVSKCSAWTEIKASFMPPMGASAFRVALAIVGRTGRVFFDDVSVKARAGAGPGPDKKLASHKVNYTRHGVLQIELRGGRRALTNAGLRLESDKEGGSSQAFATEVAVTPDENGLSFQGRMVNPLDFREVPFEERVWTENGGTFVVYQFRGDALRQIDRVTIVMTLPRVESIRGLPEAGGPPSSRLTCTSEDGDFNIEYSEPARIRTRVVDGRTRLIQSWAVDGQAEDPRFGFFVRESGSGAGILDPLHAAQDLKKQGKYGEALTLLRDQGAKTKDAQVREKIETDIRTLQETERRDWADLQAWAFQARISRRPELVTKSLQSIDTFLRQWAGEGTEHKAEGLREEIKKDLASAPDAETELPRRLFERAKKYAESGRRILAQLILQSLLSRYPNSDVSAEAQKLLQSLNQ